MNDCFSKFRKKIFFLNLISNDVYYSLDFTEFVYPNEYISNLREELERQLDAFVMTYKAEGLKLVGDFKKYLCANIKTKKLSQRELSILKNFEAEAMKHGVSFCVYQKPIEYFDNKESFCFARFF